MVLESGHGVTALRVLLVGSILQFVGGFIVIGFGAYSMGFFGGQASVPGWLGLMQLVLGALAVVGGEVGLRAYRKGRSGDLEGAFLRGLVASMLPPVQVVTLIGALLCKSAAGQVREPNPFLR